MSTRLPSRRFREAQWLITAALVLLFAMVVVEMQGMLALAKAAEEEARRGAAAAAAVIGARVEMDDRTSFASPLPDWLGVAMLDGERVASRSGMAGPQQPAWWPWSSRAEWETAGRGVAGPLRLAGGQAMVAYRPLAGGRVARVVVQVGSAPLLGRWRWVGAGLTLLVAAAGGILALLLVGRTLAPYRDLMSEAARLSERPRGEAEDRFLVDTFRAAVTRLKASEAALRQRADELALLAEVLTRESDAGVIVTDADGLVRASNPRAAALIGQALPAGVPLPGFLRETDGRVRAGERVVEVRRFPLLAAGGVAQGEVRFLADTTQLDALERALAEREQMATLGELSAGMAHELRNALATITGYLRLIPAADEEAERRYLAAIGEEANALSEVLERFLRFAQPQQLRRQAVDVFTLAREAVDKVRHTFPGAAIGLEGGPAEAQGDPLALAVVLENLVRNAAQAAGQGGTVTVRVEAGELVRVVVEDSGPGVSEEIRGRLFAPFVSTRASGGLGLALARRFARLHGGDVEYEPREGGGARFILRLPSGGVA